MGFFSKELVPIVLLAICILPHGLVLGYSAMQDDYCRALEVTDTNIKGLLSSFPAIFAILGSPGILIVVKYFGKKVACLTLTALFIIGWIFIIVATKPSLLVLFYIGRAITGFAVGASNAAVPPYIAELSPPEYRGPYGTLSQLFISFGFVITYACSCDIATFNNDPTYKIKFGYQEAAIVCMCISLVLFIFFWIIVPVSPNDLNRKGENNAEGVAQESLFQKKYMLTFIQGLLPFVFQQFSGINTFLTNLNNIFQDANLELNFGVASIFVSLSQSLSTLLTGWVLKRFGRRWAWNVSSGGQAVFLILSCINQFVIKNSSILPVLCLFFDCFFYGLGIGPLSFALMSEIIPDEVRGQAVSCAQCFNWCLAAVTIFSIQGIGGDNGYYYGFFGFFNALSVVYGLTLLPSGIERAKPVEDSEP